MGGSLSGATLGLGFLAGMLSTLSPCVLPLLPIILGASARQHRLAPLALAGGLALSFTVVGLVIATLGFAIGIDGTQVRKGAAIIMLVFGLVLMIPRLQTGFASLAQRFSGGANARLAHFSGTGVGGQALLGVLLGAVWSPCAGPTLGAAIGLAAQSDGLGPAAATMIAFSFGTATPLLLLSYGGGQALAWRKDRLSRITHWAKPAMGALLAIMGGLIASGFDRNLETLLTQAMPAWLTALTTRY